MNDTQLLELVGDTDAYASETPLPESVWSRQRSLREIERRMGMSQEAKVVVQPAHGATPAPPEKRSLRVLIAAAAFAITVVVVGAVAVVAPSDDSNQGFGAGSSMDTADQFFAAYNAGNSDSVMAMLAPGAVISDNFSGAADISEWEMAIVWDMAQGTVLSDPKCSVTTEMAQAVVMACDTETHDALVQALDAYPVPTHLTMTITTGGIQQLSFVYGQPDFATVSTPFGAWTWNHRNEDATRVGHGRWETVDEARENGLLTAKYAKEWADYLEANGCSIEDDC